jgi:hypothetical protein
MIEPCTMAVKPFCFLIGMCHNIDQEAEYAPHRNPSGSSYPVLNLKSIC